MSNEFQLHKNMLCFWNTIVDFHCVPNSIQSAVLCRGWPGLTISRGSVLWTCPPVLLLCCGTCTSCSAGSLCCVPWTAGTLPAVLLLISIFHVRVVSGPCVLRYRFNYRSGLARRATWQYIIYTCLLLPASHNINGQSTFDGG